jgi:hypothetical protein
VSVVRICAEHAVPRAFSCLAFSPSMLFRVRSRVWLSRLIPLVRACLGEEALPFCSRPTHFSRSLLGATPVVPCAGLVWRAFRCVPGGARHIRARGQRRNVCRASRYFHGCACVAVCVCSLRRITVCQIFSLSTHRACQTEKPSRRHEPDGAAKRPRALDFDVLCRMHGYIMVFYGLAGKSAKRNSAEALPAVVCLVSCSAPYVIACFISWRQCSRAAWWSKQDRCGG